MLLKVLAVPALYLHYHFNKDYMAAVLCENKARPAMKCQGKCQLRKQLAKTSESTESTKMNGSHMPTVDFCEKLETFDCKMAGVQHRTFLLVQITNTHTGYPGNIFHPPIA